MKKVKIILAITILTVISVAYIKHLRRFIDKELYYKGFCETLKEENLNCDIVYTDLKVNFLKNYRNLKSQKTQIIPKIHHLVYAFGKDETRDISDYKTGKMIKSIKKLNKEDPEWVHYFWTNDPESIPETIKNLPNVQLKNINLLKNHKLYPLILQRINSNYIPDFVENADILRIVVLQEHGGFYHDCDSEIFNVPQLNILTQNFGFVTSQEYSRHSIGNAILLSSKNHPITVEAVDLMWRNLTNSTPKYVAKNKIINSTGPIMLTIAYFKYAEKLKENNIRNNAIILPYYAFYNLWIARQEPPFNKKCTSEQKKRPMYTFQDHIKVDVIAADPLCGIWNGNEHS